YIFSEEFSLLIPVPILGELVLPAIVISCLVYMLAKRWLIFAEGSYLLLALYAVLTMAVGSSVVFQFWFDSIGIFEFLVFLIVIPMITRLNSKSLLTLSVIMLALIFGNLDTYTFAA